MNGVKPLTTIAKNINKPIKVMLKNDIAYEGTMVECDNYMNLVIEKVVEYQGENKRAGYPRVLIRGNNVLYVVLAQK
ncbi:MAG: hypothetical protein NXY59_10320 [Aigarchaeota archaeon]|nr:hypothetical protein [Candidatus Pelearchaeum maunauluense]